MARKAVTLWEVKKETRTSATDYLGAPADYLSVQWYALRADGKVLKKYQTKNLDGSARHDYGWKLAGVPVWWPGADTALAYLAARGYTVVSHTPAAKPIERARRRRRA